MNDIEIKIDCKWAEFELSDDGLHVYVQNPEGSNIYFIVPTSEALNLSQQLYKALAVWKPFIIGETIAYGFYHAKFGKHVRIALWDGGKWTIGNQEVTPSAYTPILTPNP